MKMLQWALFLLSTVLSVGAFVPSASFQKRHYGHVRMSQLADSAKTVVEHRVMDTESSAAKKQGKVSVLICPAQFCVPDDYQGLLETIKQRAGKEGVPSIGASRIAPLPRTEWIKVAKSLPTKAYLDATLSPRVTLSWYFEAMENALAEIFAAEGPDVNICVIGHSIGGWVARAYLGGLSGSSSAVYRMFQEKCTSFITIGTPHSSPDDALVDQTRGLLREVESSSQCSSRALCERGIDVTCVGSSSLQGKILTTDLEEFVAATSYLPLLGRLSSVKGDGIVPTDLAFMESPARRVEVETCSKTGVPVRHAHVFPTPWNLINGFEPSIALPDDFAWYGSEGVIDEWVKYIR